MGAMSENTIYLASDHRGLPLKSVFVKWLKDHGYEAVDLGPETTERVNATDFAVRLATAMRQDETARGVLICGTGQAMNMTANRFAHIRAALCTNTTTVRLSREHNDANVLVLGAEIVGEGLAVDCLQTFMETKALGGRYAERCQILTDLGGL